MDSSSGHFFHNVELLIGPGQSELDLERKSSSHSQLYCSLYGWPHFILINQTKQPDIVYNSSRIVTDENLTDVDFLSAKLPPGSCLFVPPDWVVGIQLNNSISLIFTLTAIDVPSTSNDDDYRLLPCTSTDPSTLDMIEFSIRDEFNLTDIGLIVYFYQYLNPPRFDRQYTAETFFEQFRDDKNVSQLIMNWTPELSELIRVTLFKQLDINNDDKFSSDDYFDIKRSNIRSIQNGIFDVLEQIRHTVLGQYNDFTRSISKLTDELASLDTANKSQAILESMIETLPDSVKEILRETNVNVRELMDKSDRKKEKSKRLSSTDGQQRRIDDVELLFDRNSNEQTQSNVDENEHDEEEIIAEPNIMDENIHRADL
jgi:hypothetical protein